MCGIVAGIAERNVTPILLEGLRRLEYRGYDSAGVALINQDNEIDRVRVLGKVNSLADAIEQQKGVSGHIGIAHTRWATHGKPSVDNAHPHICRDKVALVHNGIIENHEVLKRQQLKQGFEFTSETDTEVVVNQVCIELNDSEDLLTAVNQTLKKLEGAYALGVMSISDPDTLIAARKGSPLVIGVGIGEYFIASDVFALLPVTQKFIFLEEGDVAKIEKDSLTIFDAQGNQVQRTISVSELNADMADKSGYRHYMLKEIFSQPKALADSLESRIINGQVNIAEFGQSAETIFPQVKAVKIIACGTSYHAGLTAKYWMEDIAGVRCDVEVASEYRYRTTVEQEGTLLVTISQSGETADTLAALQKAKSKNYLSTLAICNVAESSLTREAELVFMTRAGPEIGVASTKAFTTQLVGLLLLVISLGRFNGLTKDDEAKLVSELKGLPGKVNQILELNEQIKELSKQFANKHHALYLGRGNMLPISMEGALKLKEISYIHAEAYPAGELKHGPLALVDEEMPIVAIAPNNELLEKLKSNLKEVQARGGELYLFADSSAEVDSSEFFHVIDMHIDTGILEPILFTIPLQLLSYYIAVIKGADIDQPRNLAKSVTVE